MSPFMAWINFPAAEDVILELENQSISNDGTFYVGFQDQGTDQELLSASGIWGFPLKWGYERWMVFFWKIPI